MGMKKIDVRDYVIDSLPIENRGAVVQTVGKIVEAYGRGAEQGKKFGDLVGKYDIAPNFEAFLHKLVELHSEGHIDLAQQEVDVEALLRDHKNKFLRDTNSETKPLEHPRIFRADSRAQDIFRS